MSECDHNWVVQYAERLMYEFPISLSNGNLVIHAHSKGPEGVGVEQIEVRCTKCDALDYGELFSEVIKALNG